MENKKEKNEFWLDTLSEQILEKHTKEKIYHLSCGLSIRGPQHIGRLRGELCIPSSVKKILEQKHKKKAVHYIVIYDMDGMKPNGVTIGFPNDPDKQKKYTGVSLFNIPDPYGCCKNWQEHFWKDFGDYLEDFGFKVEIVKTSEFYKMPETKKVVKYILENREKVVKFINQFRERNPWPEDFIPINPTCNKCLSIMDTTATGFDLKKYTVDYECKRCSDKGTVSLEKSKLNWRLEWPTLWKVLHIEFEPYGKDHASAGSSRETCGRFAKEILGYEPPLGEWNEWVAIKIKGEDKGEMTASGFVGITPKQWLEIAEPEVLKYLYIRTRPHTKMTLDMDKIPDYYDDYNKGERIFYGKEKTDEREEYNIKKSFELSQIRKIPSKMQFQFAFSFAAQLTQIFPEKKKTESVIEILKKIKQLKGKPTEFEKDRIEKRLELAKTWLEKYASDRFKFKIVDKLDEKIKGELSNEQRAALKDFGKFLEKRRKDDEIINKIKELASAHSMTTTDIFKIAYIVLIGKDHGPRLIPLIQSLDRDFVVKRFKLEK